MMIIKEHLQLNVEQFVFVIIAPKIGQLSIYIFYLLEYSVYDFFKSSKESLVLEAISWLRLSKSCFLESIS